MITPSSDHAIGEMRTTYFMHFWGVEATVELAIGPRATPP
jgi:hypothetical protein